MDMEELNITLRQGNKIPAQNKMQSMLDLTLKKTILKQQV
jgi:hypothetical protein